MYQLAPTLAILKSPYRHHWWTLQAVVLIFVSVTIRKVDQNNGAEPTLEQVHKDRKWLNEAGGT